MASLQMLTFAKRNIALSSSVGTVKYANKARRPQLEPDMERFQVPFYTSSKLDISMIRTHSASDVSLIRIHSASFLINDLFKNKDTQLSVNVCMGEQSERFHPAM